MRAARRGSLLLLLALASLLGAVLFGSGPVQSNTVPTIAVLQFDANTVPDPGETFGDGDIIRVFVNTNGEVTVVGTPRVGILIGDVTRYADFDRSSFVASTGFSGSWLYFKYEVQPGERDRDGISIAANSIDLPAGASITATGGGPNANLDHSAQGPDSNRKVAALGMRVSDVTPSPVPEGTTGNTGTYKVGLGKAPTSNVEISVTSGDSTALTVSPATLTFRPDNWDTEQTVTVTAVEDDDYVDETVTLTHSVVDASSDDTYDPVADVTLDVTVDDNDEAPPTITQLDVRWNASFLAGDGPLIIPAGEVIAFDVTFDADVKVTGVPRIAIMLDRYGGTTPYYAEYQGVQYRDDRVTFLWTTQTNDFDGTGVSTGAVIEMPAPTTTDTTECAETNTERPDTCDQAAITSATNDNLAANESLGTHALTNDASHLVDGVAPVLRNARLTADSRNELKSLVLTFDEELDLESVPPVAAFTVTQGSTTLTVDDVTVDKELDAKGEEVLEYGEPVSHRTVTLTMMSAVTPDPDRDLKVSYIPFYQPRLESISGTTVTLVSKLPLPATYQPGPTDFTVQVNRVNNPVTNVAVSGSTVTLTLTNSVSDADVENGNYSLQQTYVFSGWGFFDVLIGDAADVVPNLLQPFSDYVVRTPPVVNWVSFHDGRGDRTDEDNRPEYLPSNFNPDTQEGTYDTGELIVVGVNLSPRVVVEVKRDSDGNPLTEPLIPPHILLKLGDGTVTATYDPDLSRLTAGTSTLMFTYTVEQGKMDSDGVSVLDGEIVLNSYEINDAQYPEVGAHLELDHDGNHDGSVTGPGTDGKHGTSDDVSLTDDPARKVNGFSPAFVADSYAFNLAENARLVTDEDGNTTAVSIGSVSATAGHDGSLTYNITAGNTGNVFAIDSSSGTITYVGTGEDHERFSNPAAAFTLTVAVNDGLKADNSADTTTDDTATVTISVTNVDEPQPAPVLANTNQRATVGQAFSYTFTHAVDPTLDRFTYEFTGKPSWLGFDPSTRTFRGTPGADDVTGSPITITVGAMGDTFQSADPTFTLTVSAPVARPVPAPGGGGGGGGGGGFVPAPRPTVQVGRSGGETTLTTVRAGESTATIRLGNRNARVDVSVDRGSVGATLTLPTGDEALADLDEITFEVVAASETPAMPRGFRIAGGQTIIDIVLLDSDGNEITELTEPATVCLPVDDETTEQAGERPLELLHYDSESGWTALANAELRTVNGASLLCAETTSFSLFTVGIRLGSDAGLGALSLGETPLSPSFATGQTAYEASLAHGVDRLTVTAEAAQGGTTVAILPADADASAPGHQVDLAVGDNAIRVTVTAEDGVTTSVYTITAHRAGSLPAPPEGGWTEGRAGTGDIDALVASQPYKVEVVWAWDPRAQEWLGHWPDGPAFVNTLDAALRPDTIVFLLRAGDAPERGETPTAPLSPAWGVANKLPAPPPGGWTLGVSGTNDPAALAAAQSFEVDTVALWHTPSQQWLLYFPSGPAFINSLTRGLLQPNSVVWLLRGSESDFTEDPAPESESEPQSEPEAEAEVESEAEAESESDPDAKTYTVAAGDTLLAIACTCHVRVDDLAAANDIADPSRIYVGQVLTLPPAPSETYTVVEGDNLWDIARRLGVSYADLVEINCIDDPSRILVGDVLAVPRG